MQVAKVDDLAEIYDLAEVDRSLWHALGEDFEAADGTLERLGLVAIAAAGLTDI